MGLYKVFTAFATIVGMGVMAQTNVSTFDLGPAHGRGLPKFLTNNPLPNGFPWGDRTSRNDPKNPPHTGVVRHFDWTISRSVGAPDGFEKQLLLVNGQFPGPLLEANWGDTIEVTVTNNITGPEEGTSIHWHGLLQKGTPWMDGVPAVSQCPIAPGSSFTYRFRADVYGTSWYHSHYSAQYIAGLYGPIVIHGPSHVDYDFDMGPVLVQDWFHLDYLTLIDLQLSSNASLQAQSTDNTLINGRNPFNCSLASPGGTCTPNAPMSEFRVETGKKYKIRLVNSGAGDIYYFGIDNHQLTIVANDFVDVEPYVVDLVTLGTGQRTDVIWTPSGNGSVWMRAFTFGRFCGAARALTPSARAPIFLGSTPSTQLPTTTGWPTPADDGTCANNPLNETIPHYPIPVPDATVTFNITINQFVNATGQKLFYMNGNSFRADFNQPILNLANEKNFSYPDLQWNNVDFGRNKSIRINVWNNNSSPHPMHLHGHDFFVLHEGPGQWDGASITRPENPQRRDTQNLWPKGHMVIQFEADNPGTWAFHCHIASHLSQGLFMSFTERPDEFDTGAIQSFVKDTCQAWDAWTAQNVVVQPDSGLRKRRIRVEA